MKLLDADAIVRSKNAGPFRYTLDVIFNNRKEYEAMKTSGVWNKNKLCTLFKISEEDVIECVDYEPAMSFKLTFRRRISSGAFGDNDVYGAQQHIALYGITF